MTSHHHRSPLRRRTLRKALLAALLAPQDTGRSRLDDLIDDTIMAALNADPNALVLVAEALDAPPIAVPKQRAAH